MTQVELQVEYDHIIANRLGNLCENREPTPEQLAVATKEAEEWKERWLQPSPNA